MAGSYPRGWKRGSGHVLGYRRRSGRRRAPRYAHRVRALRRGMRRRSGRRRRAEGRHRRDTRVPALVREAVHRRRVGARRRPRAVRIRRSRARRHVRLAQRRAGSRRGGRRDARAHGRDRRRSALRCAPARVRAGGRRACGARRGALRAAQQLQRQARGHPCACEDDRRAVRGVPRAVASRAAAGDRDVRARQRRCLRGRQARRRRLRHPRVRDDAAQSGDLVRAPGRRCAASTTPTPSRLRAWRARWRPSRGTSRGPRASTRTSCARPAAASCARPAPKACTATRCSTRASASR